MADKSTKTFLAKIVLNVKFRGGQQEEFEKLTRLPSNFTLAPGNLIPVCKANGGWHLAEIEYAVGTPSFIPEGNRIEVWTELDLRNTEVGSDEMNTRLAAYKWENARQ